MTRKNKGEQTVKGRDRREKGRRTGAKRRKTEEKEETQENVRKGGPGPVMPKNSQPWCMKN